MKTLHLLRHGKSSWAEPDLPDRERPLAPRGRRAATRIARYISDERLAVDLVLCSTALRARQTLAAIAPKLGPGVRVEVEEEFYSVDAEALLARLHELPTDVKAALVIGHDPCLHDLALRLAGTGEDEQLAELRAKLPTGGLATITFRGAWSGLRPGAGELRSLVLPRKLK